MVKNFYFGEQLIVEHLKECLDHCVVQGVPDYWWVVQKGAAFAKAKTKGETRAGVYVFYAGERIPQSDSCCVLSEHLYVVAVVTVNRCHDDPNNGFLARQENGEYVNNVICCMSQLCDSGSCNSLKRAAVPQLPIPLDDNGVVTTYLAYTLERADQCA